MKITKAKLTSNSNWVNIWLEDGTQTQVSVEDNVRRQYTDLYNEWLEDGNTPEPEFTPEEKALNEYNKAKEDWKADRQSKVDNIEVEYNGIIYQGDETSQTRMDRASRSLEKRDLAEPDNTPHTTTWVAKDNSEHQLNSEDLANLVMLAGEIQSSIWSTGRPTLKGEN
jgi:hypothetical protein